MYYYARCVSRTTEWTTLRTNRRSGSRLDQSAGSREVRYVNYRPTYVSLSRSTTSHIPRPIPLICGLPRLPADSSWNGPHRRSRCTQGSRETDESTLRPERRPTLVLPSFDLAAKAARRAPHPCEQPGFQLQLVGSVLLTISFAPPLPVWFLASRTHPIDRWGIHDVGRCVGNEPWEPETKRMERSPSTNQERPGTLRYLIATALMHENHHLVQADGKGRNRWEKTTRLIDLRGLTRGGDDPIWPNRTFSIRRVKPMNGIAIRSRSCRDLFSLSFVRDHRTR